MDGRELPSWRLYYMTKSHEVNGEFSQIDNFTRAPFSACGTEMQVPVATLYIGEAFCKGSTKSL